MKSSYIASKKTTIFKVFGYSLLIEYRQRLKVFDLVFYPNVGTMYGQRQYYDKVIVRSDDFLELASLVIKISEAYAVAQHSFQACFKLAAAEYELCKTLRNVSAPAHSSTDATSR